MGNYIDIYSNSFGPANSGYVVDGPNHVLNLSLATAVQQVQYNIDLVNTIEFSTWKIKPLPVLCT